MVILVVVAKRLDGQARFALHQQEDLEDTLAHARARGSRPRSGVIAHRLSTITHADLILVLQDGEIIEQGRTHSGHLRAKRRRNGKSPNNHPHSHEHSDHENDGENLKHSKEGKSRGDIGWRTFFQRLGQFLQAKQARLALCRGMPCSFFPTSRMLASLN